jgi:acetyltransferase EpsM
VTARPLVVLGGGEHARVLIETARSRPGEWDVVGTVDPSPSASAVVTLGIPYLGDDEAFAAAERAASAHDVRPWRIVGIGGTDPGPRRAVVELFDDSARWATVIHATAWVSPTAIVEPGAVVFAGSTVNAGAYVGRHTIVNSGAVVEHDVTLGAFAHIAPGAVIGGGASIGEGAFVGLGARVRDHVAVGDGAVVGMGAVVVADVASHSTVVGTPARARETADA